MRQACGAERQLREDPSYKWNLPIGLPESYTARLSGASAAACPGSQGGVDILT